MILAGFLPSVSGQIQYFTLRLVLNFTEIEIPGDPIVFQGISNPIWKYFSYYYRWIFILLQNLYQFLLYYYSATVLTYLQIAHIFWSFFKDQVNFIELCQHQHILEDKRQIIVIWMIIVSQLLNLTDYKKI